MEFLEKDSIHGWGQLLIPMLLQLRALAWYLYNRKNNHVLAN